MKLTLIFPKRELFDPERIEFWDLAFGHSSMSMKMAGALTDRAVATPLTLPIMASLLPDDIDVILVDEHIEQIDFTMETDLVILSFFTSEATRGYAIADTFRERNVPVVIGGYHASRLPEEAGRHADCVAIGEAEVLLLEIIRDFRAGKMKALYEMKESERPDLGGQPIPKWDLVPLDKYINPMIQTMRGCPMKCEFCSVSIHWGPKYRYRPIHQVIEEIKMVKDRLWVNARLMIVDDDISANRKRSKELFKALMPLNMKWMSQGSLAMAKDDEFMDLMALSGGTRVITGFESISEKTLSDMKKNPANKIAEYSKDAGKIQSHGISLISTFVIGYDNDDTSTFEHTSDFIIGNHFGLPQIFIVTPFPGTVMTQRLENEGRILSKDWKRYIGTTVQFKPKLMSPEELQNGYYYMNQKIFSYEFIYSRMMGLWDLWDRHAPLDPKTLLREKIDNLLLNQSFNFVSYRFPQCYHPDQARENRYKKELNSLLRSLLKERSSNLQKERDVEYA